MYCLFSLFFAIFQIYSLKLIITIQVADSIFKQYNFVYNFLKNCQKQAPVFTNKSYFARLTTEK